MKAWELFTPTDHNRVQRQVGLYALWLLERQGKAPAEFDGVEIWSFEDDPGRVEFVGSGDDGRIIYELPGPSMCEWRERCRINGQKHKDKPFPRPHKFKGITVLERWPWTDARRWEERDNIAKLFRPMPGGTIYVPLSKEKA